MQLGLIDALRGPLGLMQVLVVCSVALPLLLLGGEAWVSYGAALHDAQRELQRVSEVAREHAAKVFDRQTQAADRVLDLVQNLEPAEVQRTERALHDQLAATVARLVHVQSVMVAGVDGHPLVSAGSYPVPRDVDLTRRDYFKAVIGGYDGTYVSGLQVGDVNKRLFFGLARPWTGPNGELKGVIDVAVAPAFFEDFYKLLVEEGGDGPKGKVITMFREDGQVLVRYPVLDGPAPRASSADAFSAATAAHPDEGVYEGRSFVDPDAPLRLFSFRKVQGYPVYVVAGRSRATIVAGWAHGMVSHLVFGIPATVALFAVTWTVLERTRREQEALTRARQEIQRREQAEAALLKAQRLEAVGQLTGGVAHDFNNLLMVILGSAELVMRRADDPSRVRAFVQQIMVAAKRGGEITQQLLAFSGRQSLQPQTVNLNRRLQDFKPLLERAARSAIQVDLDFDGGLDPVRLDPGHFESAVLNLVVNARDAMPDGGGIVIATRNKTIGADGNGELAPGRYVSVTVTDTGSGMDAATIAKAFEPFFTTKDVGQGTGLGLSQVFGFAKQAGGDVRILSQLGIGTTVEIRLPATNARSGDERGRGAGERLASDVVPLRQATQGEVVLIVEDEAGVREATVESLRDLGYTTITAASAEAALAHLSGPDRIDVLFSDVVMPGGMNGLQLSVAARRLRPSLKVLLTSGYSAGFEQDNAVGIPMLPKPYDRRALASHLHDVLNG